ncbi:fibrous sheath-interacting protein 2 [Sylvia atricapilla]|uniref:fibrous sheath-interacting protein 2 n=1 Tax=Sylvia atricapilla TaxID=48155 RepID=UPI00339A9F83
MDSHLLNLPLGVKIYVKPKSNTVFCRGKLGEKLHGPCPFNFDDPYIRCMSLQYNCLHDPHLRDYHKRKDILRMLKRQGVITLDNKVVCTAKEFNDYRHYLTRIKLQIEKILGQQEVGKTLCSGARDCAGLCCWAGLCSEERTPRLGAEPAQGAELGTGSRAMCRHTQ